MAGHDTGSFAGIRINPYAAMPSMHVGWSVLVAIVGFRATSRRLLRIFFVAHPFLMAVTVTATGNHYFIDSIAGASAALAAVVMVALFRRHRSRFSGRVRLAGLLTLQADPVARAFVPCAEGDGNHRHAASGADRRTLVIHALKYARILAGGMAIVIERRFCGPEESGNGGYSAGLFASAFGGGEVEVTLRLPPPLETPLELGADGCVRDGDAVIAEVRRGDVGIAPPARVSWPEAVAAQAPDLESPFPQCFVCGHARGEDGLHIHAGPVERRGCMRRRGPSATTPSDRSSSGLRSIAPVRTRRACWGGAPSSLVG